MTYFNQNEQIIKNRLNKNMNKKQEPYKAPLKSIIGMTIIQLTFYGIGILFLYWIYTQNWVGLGIFIALIIIQYPFQGRSKKYIHFLTNYMKGNYYSNLTRQYQQKIQQNQKTIFCFHPHSVFCYGLIFSLNHPSYPDQKLSNAVGLASNFVLSMPLVGIHMKNWGMQSADNQHFKQLMRDGKDIAMLPGGYEQATLTTPKQVRVFIKERKGFIKYALEYGYTIRQVLIMNQHKVMSTFDKFLNLRLLINKLKVPGVIYWCRYGLFFPPNVKLTTIVGKGIKGNIGSQKPTNQQINEFHQKYIKELKQFYQRHKNKNQNVQLKIY